MKLYTLLPISRYIKPGIQTTPLEEELPLENGDLYIGDFHGIRVETDNCNGRDRHKNFIGGLMHSANTKALIDENILYDTISLYHACAKQNKKCVIFESIGIFVSYEEGEVWSLKQSNDTISTSVQVTGGIILIVKATELYQKIEFALMTDTGRIKNYRFTYSVGKLTI